jgi:hypothetical protein
MEDRRDIGAEAMKAKNKIIRRRRRKRRIR